MTLSTFFKLISTDNRRFLKFFENHSKPYALNATLKHNKLWFLTKFNFIKKSSCFKLFKLFDKKYNSDAKLADEFFYQFTLMEIFEYDERQDICENIVQLYNDLNIVIL